MKGKAKVQRFERPDGVIFQETDRILLPAFRDEDGEDHPAQRAEILEVWSDGTAMVDITAVDREPDDYDGLAEIWLDDRDERDEYRYSHLRE